MCLLNLVWCISSFFVYAYTNSDDLITASSSVLDALTTVNMSLKGWIAFCRKKDIMKIYYELQGIFDSHLDKNKKYQIKKYLREYQIATFIYLGSIVMVSLPIGYPIIKFFTQGVLEMSLKWWYPFDVFKRNIFLIHLVYAQWCVCNNLGYALSADSMLYAFIKSISIEFNILKEDLMTIDKTPENERSRKIKTLTSRHNQLLGLCDRFQNIYSISFLVNFAVSSMIMCFVAFRLVTAGADTFIYLFYIPYMCIMSCQILLLCYFGQMLTDGSEAPTKGAYNSNWETFSDNDVKKQFILIMIRSQRAKRLTAMGFTEISLTTFTAVCI